MSKKENLYKYMDDIMYAKLDGKAKGLLYFYAHRYNWSKNLPSYWSERTICALTSMSPSTYQEKRKYLEDLGWIVVKKRGRQITSLVGVKVGNDDPLYEDTCWAAWHPYNGDNSLENFWDNVEESDKGTNAAPDQKEDPDNLWGIFESR
jgi:hypothetical protein